MSRVQGHTPWFIVDSTYGTIPEHYHVVACDEDSPDKKELELLGKTPKIKLPLQDDVLIGVPAHNEHDHIGGVVCEARKYGHVLVYCDGCTDSTADRAYAAGADYVVEGNPNLGYGGSLSNIFRFAKDHDYEKLVILDGDGQHDPHQIPQFIQGVTYADVIIGNRFLGSHNTPAYRQLVIKTINAVLGVGDSQCGFRAYSRKAIEAIKVTDYGMGASLEILNRAKEHGLSLAEVPCNIVYEDTQHSTSTFKHGKMLAETLFWSLVWGKPLTVLVTPALALGGYGLYALFKTAYLYQSINTFSIGLATVGVGALMMGLLLFIAAIIVIVGRRQLKEMKN